jgi:hypothetical protein
MRETSVKATTQRSLIRMRRFLSAAIAAAAAALAAGLGTVPATAAATTWTVTPGGAFTNPFARQTRLEDLFNHRNYGCQPTKMTGTFHSGSGLANPIGQIATMPGPKTSSMLCALPGSSFLITFTHFPMNIRAGHYNAATGVTQGIITGIHIKISTVPGQARCTGTIDGTGPNADNARVPFTFTNTGGELDGELETGAAATGLTAYNVSGCGGRIHSGDAFSYQVIAFPRTATGVADTITSP